MVVSWDFMVVLWDFIVILWDVPSSGSTSGGFTLWIPSGYVKIAMGNHHL